MTLQATIPAQFVLCPPLDLPLRLNAENGCFGCARTSPYAFGDCCSDHFISVHPDSLPGIHQVHEAVDLASTEGACVYAAYSGVVTSIGSNDLDISHVGVGEGYATKYVHVTPLVAIGNSVVKGQPIAEVQANAAVGDHLHFGLWHWVEKQASPLLVSLSGSAIPLDPTRLLYHWERDHQLNWATIGALDAQVLPILDAATPDASLLDAFVVAGIEPVQNPAIIVLVPGCAWRIVGDNGTYLLRHERAAITVFDERYGSDTVMISAIDQVGFVYRRKVPTFMVEANEITYGIPLHDVENDRLHGAGFEETTLIELLRQAFEQRSEVELDLRRSAFWAMDGSLDEYQAVVHGVRLSY